MEKTKEEAQLEADIKVVWEGLELERHTRAHLVDPEALRESAQRIVSYSADLSYLAGRAKEIASRKLQYKPE